jgi:hypothetical protein
VVAATEHLHRKIARRGKRIQMLEDALTALYASKGGVVGAVHPLLVDGENFADDGAPGRTSESWEVLEAAHNGTSLNANPELDAFGTLSISDHGISTFFGPTGRCEVCTVFLFAVYALSVAAPHGTELPFRSYHVRHLACVSISLHWAFPLSFCTLELRNIPLFRRGRGPQSVVRIEFLAHASASGKSGGAHL